MAELPPYRTPRWVKVVGITALVLALLVAIVLLTGIGGEHGPGRHVPSGGATTTLPAIAGENSGVGGRVPHEFTLGAAARLSGGKD